MSGIFKGEIGNLKPLGIEGAKAGADAVIGINIISKASSGGWILTFYNGNSYKVY